MPATVEMKKMKPLAATVNLCIAKEPSAIATVWMAHTLTAIVSESERTFSYCHYKRCYIAPITSNTAAIAGVGIKYQQLVLTCEKLVQ